MLLTGARKTELLRAKWEHVDLERRLWLIPETKNGTSRHVPLSEQAMEVIGKLPRWKDCEWLIPNPKTRKPYNQIKRAWNTARNAAGYEGLRLHDLRHSFCSSAVVAGVDLYTVGKIAGHKDYKSSQRYSHLADETLMKAVEKSAANLNVDWGGWGKRVNHTIKLSGRTHAVRSDPFKEILMTDLSIRVDAPPSPAENDALFDRLQALDRACGGPDGDKHVRAITLIQGCIAEGIDTKSRIISVLRAIGFDYRHIALTLKRYLGSDPERHFWRADEDGTLHALT